ncbi:hypothetical protein RCL1_003873 [Eukaryota sp. TZLM3-RCL]
MPFRCTYPDCNKSYTRRPHLARHINSFHLGIKCHCTHPGCGKSFSCPDKLNRHIKKLHTDPEVLTCPQENCQANFKKRCHLSKHLREVHSVADFPQICPICSKGFYYASKLKRHMEKHDKVETLLCAFPGCGAVFSTRSELSAHKRQAHSSTLRCPHCPARFRKRCHYDVHVETHNVNRTLLPCPHPGCGKFFTSDFNLNTHFNSVHAKIKPHVCNVCNRSFAHKHVLTRHKRTHANGVETVEVDEVADTSTHDTPELIANIGEPPVKVARFEEEEQNDDDDEEEDFEDESGLSSCQDTLDNASEVSDFSDESDVE